MKKENLRSCLVQENRTQYGKLTLGVKLENSHLQQNKSNRNLEAESQFL